MAKLPPCKYIYISYTSKTGMHGIFFPLLLNCQYFVFLIVNNEIVKNILSESAKKHHVASIIKPYVSASVIKNKNKKVTKNS